MNEAVVKIHVALLGEGTKVWRPVRANLVSDNIYRIIEQPYDRGSETWEFTPGSEVVCEQQYLSGGTVLVAVSGRLCGEN